MDTEDQTLTIIMCLPCADDESLFDLGKRLLCLVGGMQTPVQPVVVSPALPPDDESKVKEMIEGFDWALHEKPGLFCLSRSAEKRLGAGALLNLGMDQAHGRYLAFLGFGQLAYEHAYSTLMESCLKLDAEAAAGGWVRARISHYPAGDIILGKDPLESSAQRGVPSMPLCCLVLDRNRLGDRLPRFDDSEAPEREFVRRLAETAKIDFSCGKRSLFEQRVGTGQSGAKPD